MRSSSASVRKASAWAAGLGGSGVSSVACSQLLPGLIVLRLVRQQQPQSQPRLELLWVRGDGLAVVGGGGILVAAGILHIAKVEERAGIARILAQILLQQRPGALEILLLDLAFGRFPLRLGRDVPWRRTVALSGAWVPGGS